MMNYIIILVAVCIFHNPPVDSDYHLDKKIVVYIYNYSAIFVENDSIVLFRYFVYLIQKEIFLSKRDVVYNIFMDKERPAT